MKVLVAGGAGYIGSHFVRLLVEHQIPVVVVDNLYTGARETVPEGVPFVQGDIGDREQMREVLTTHKPDAVVDFAGLIQVGESVQKPDLYYRVNLVHTLAFLDEIVAAGVQSFVFSSTAAVYGNPIEVPIVEDHPKAPINPYGSSKLGVERAAMDYAHAFGLRFAALRYFNAAGAHPSGELGELHDPESHLIPLALDAAFGFGPGLTIFGDDWPTPDGTCIRDYIHVVDLAEAHLRALELLQSGRQTIAVNLGSGNGSSVREVLSAIEKVTGSKVPVKMGPRRAGDPPRLVAAVQKALDVLGWKTRCSDIETIVEDAARARRLHRPGMHK